MSIILGIIFTVIIACVVIALLLIVPLVAGPVITIMISALNPVIVVLVLGMIAISSLIVSYKFVDSLLREKSQLYGC